MELWDLITSAGAGMVASLLTYLATRRQAQVQEREVYIRAVEQLTGSLREEIERVNANRLAFAGRVEELEARIAHYEEAERELKRKVSELEDREQALLLRIEQLESERDQLRADLVQAQGR
jgi:chromosome segregation ATPase